MGKLITIYMFLQLFKILMLICRNPTNCSLNSVGLLTPVVDMWFLVTGMSRLVFSNRVAIVYLDMVICKVKPYEFNLRRVIY